MSDEVQPTEPHGSPGGGRAAAWAELLRLPNLLTVPGDPLVGFLLACRSAEAWPARPLLRAALAAAVSLLLYAAGLLLNDWFDLREDLRDRPRRPLPSGRIRPATAALAANVLLLLAVAVAAVLGRRVLYMTVAVGAAAVLYDAGCKRVAVLGPLLMGACRGGSLLIGAIAAGTAVLADPLTLAGAALLTAYVAAVSAVAARETRGGVGRRRTLPAAAAAFVFTFVALTFLPWPPAPVEWAFLALAVASVAWAVAAGLKLDRRADTDRIQKTVGLFLQGLLPIQAALAALGPHPGIYVAAGLLAAWPVCTLLARRFRPS